MAIKLFAEGFYVTLGVLIAVLLIVGIVMLVKYLVEESEERSNKAKRILKDLNTYVKKQMYEELYYINKYKQQLENGKWPGEMNEKFEELDSDTEIFDTTFNEEGEIEKKKIRLLKLKDCFKHSLTNKKIENSSNDPIQKQQTDNSNKPLENDDNNIQ